MPDLVAAAAELSLRADALREQALRVGTAPDRVRWSSAGARAWADGIAEIRILLLRAADQVDDSAAALRAKAAAATNPFAHPPWVET